jgi:hypothetical protein
MGRAIDTRSQILQDTQVLNRTQVPKQIRIARNVRKYLRVLKPHHHTRMKQAPSHLPI